MAARGATPLAGDLDDGAALAGIFARAGCDALVNLASLGFGHAPGIVRAAVRSGLDRAVFVSTTAVTTTLPARSKTVRLAAEDEIRSSDLSWTILRPTMIYGAAGDRNLSRLLVLLARLRAPVPRACRLSCQCPAAGGSCSSPSTWRTWPGRCWRRWSGRRRQAPSLRRGRSRAADVRRRAARVRRPPSAAGFISCQYRSRR